MSVLTGNKLKLTVFGGSHEKEIGMILEGLPAGLSVDTEDLYAFLLRRAPGHTEFSTSRCEDDRPIFESGLKNGKTTGDAIKAVIRNQDHHSVDYEMFKRTPRPSHADFAALCKYGHDVDLRGGGAFSGRLTAPMCIAGGMLKQLLEKRGIIIGAHILQIGNVTDDLFDAVNISKEELLKPQRSDFPVLSPMTGEKMKEIILQVKEAGNSLGGIVECAAIGIPAGYGGEQFDGLESKLCSALFGIPGVRGVQFGSGFAAASMTGSEHNDPFTVRNGKVVTMTNHSGGIQGGITNGMPLVFSVAFKPTPSIALPQQTVDLSDMTETTITVSGRHDPCFVPRAVPVVEALTAFCLYDLLEDGYGT